MELKYLMNKMKNGIESIKIIYKTEEGASEIEERNFEITQRRKKENTKKEKQLKKILFEVWKIIKRDNIQIIGITEIREKMAESLSKAYLKLSKLSY